MFKNRREGKDLGLTLLEVLLSLIITGIVMSVVLNFYISHYRLVKHVMSKTELNYSLLRAGQVLTSAVKIGEKVEWTGKVLKITYKQGEKEFCDSYYLADKNFDEISDLYREHLAVPNPVVTGVTFFNCIELDQGFWEISLRAGEGVDEVYWKRKVKQKLQID
jgi:hypothetical protein